MIEKSSDRSNGFLYFHLLLSFSPWLSHNFYQ